MVFFPNTRSFMILIELIYFLCIYCQLAKTNRNYENNKINIFHLNFSVHENLFKKSENLRNPRNSEEISENIRTEISQTPRNLGKLGNLEASWKT